MVLISKYKDYKVKKLNKVKIDHNTKKQHKITKLAMI